MVAKVKLNLSGFRKLRKHFDDEVMRRAENVAEGANQDLVARGHEAGYKAEASPSKNRARATVYADSIVAVEDNANNLTLLKNFGKAR